MNPLLALWVLVPCLALAVHSVAHVLVMRARTDLRTLPAFLMGFGAGIIAEVTADAWIAQLALDPVGAWLHTGAPNLLAFFALSYSYFHFVNLGETGRRIRILVELYRAPNGLTENELLVRYDSNEILRRRIERLTTAGQIDLREGRAYGTGRAMWCTARFIMFLKYVVAGRDRDVGEKEP